MKALSVVVAVSFAVSALASSPSPTAGRSGGSKRALLIGINLYQPQGTKAEHTAGCQGGRCDLHEIKNLEGPLNDVAAIRDLLSSPKFAFDPKNIAVITNPALPPTQLPYNNLAASQTTRDGLLSVMQRYLVDLPNRGDTVVFFYAGHGSLRVNSKGTKLAIQLGDGTMSHADSTLVASDAWTGNYDIRDREMTRIFHAALDKGVKLTVLLDSCHSGSFTRGVESLSVAAAGESGPHLFCRAAGPVRAGAALRRYPKHRSRSRCIHHSPDPGAADAPGRRSRVGRLPASSRHHRRKRRGGPDAFTRRTQSAP